MDLTWKRWIYTEKSIIVINEYYLLMKAGPNENIKKFRYDTVFLI